MGIKIRELILIVLLIFFLAWGMYFAIRGFGYLAFLSGIFCGKLFTHIYFYLKKNSSKT